MAEPHEFPWMALIAKKVDTGYYGNTIIIYFVEFLRQKLELGVDYILYNLRDAVKKKKRDIE